MIATPWHNVVALFVLRGQIIFSISSFDKINLFVIMNSVLPCEHGVPGSIRIFI